MVVEIRKGQRYLVLLDGEIPQRELISFSGGYLPLDNYNCDLKDIEGDYMWDIMKVCSLGNSIVDLLEDKDEAMRNAKVLWEREGKSITMTVSQIEKKLGIENLKIVKE